MKRFAFPREQRCPACKGTFSDAEQRIEYDPVVVITCPHCQVMLWRPGLDDQSSLFVFNPDADRDGI
jgi:hypothetical protein